MVHAPFTPVVFACGLWRALPICLGPVMNRAHMLGTAYLELVWAILFTHSLTRIFGDKLLKQCGIGFAVEVYIVQPAANLTPEGG